jgi:hypothetical protein
MPFAERQRVLALLCSTDLVIFDLTDPAQEPLPLVTAHPLVGLHVAQGIAGGTEAITEGVMLDLEGDGDADLMELEMGAFVAVHRSERGASFAPGADLGAGPYVDVRAEHPFIAVGDAQAAFIVNNASGEDGTGPPTVQPLECVP